MIMLCNLETSQGIVINILNTWDYYPVYNKALIDCVYKTIVFYEKAS